MKTILCYGDSNTWGAIPRRHIDDIRRYPAEHRWVGVLQRELGPDFSVIGEGLRGRTTVWDDPIEGHHKNGSTTLIPCLESHSPLDFVVLFLGTNDLKSRFSISEHEIALGIDVLIKTIYQSNTGINGIPPQILVLAPPPVARLTFFAEIFDGAVEKSKKLGSHYKGIAEKNKCLFLDTSEIIETSNVDGIHFDSQEHCKLGKVVAQIIREYYEIAYFKLQAGKSHEEILSNSTR